MSFKVGLSASIKNFFSLQWWLFKDDEKCFLFHLKSSFRSLDIQIFGLIFWACRKNGSIRAISLIWIFITSQPGLQRIITHLLLNISRIKGNQTMKFDQLIDHPKRYKFLWKLCRKWSRETSSKLLFVF